MTASFSDPTRWTADMSAVCQDSLAAFSGLMEAFARSTQAAWQGAEAMTRDASETLQSSMTRGMSACQTMMSVKSPNEAAERQADYLRETFDRMLASGSRLSELSLHTARSSMEPLNQQMTRAMDKAMRQGRA